MSTPGTQPTDRLVVALQSEVDDGLRKVVEYDTDDLRTRYCRDDVHDGVDERRVQDVRLESLSQSFHESVAPETHGDLTCQVKCYENVVELNFTIGDASGVLVTLEPYAVTDAHALVDQVRRAVDAEVGIDSDSDIASSVTSH